MSLRSMAGRALDFAHFGGLARGAKKADDDEMKRDDEAERCEDDEEAAASAEEEPEGEPKDEDEGRRGKKGKKKARKAKKKDGDEDDNDEDEDGGSDGDEEDTDEDEDEEAKKSRKAHRAGARAERARCAQIFNHPAAARNPQLACKLAFDPKSELSAGTAIALLEASAPQPAQGEKRNGLNDRMSDRSGARVPPNNASGRDPQGAVAVSWDVVMKDFMPPAR